MLSGGLEYETYDQGYIGMVAQQSQLFTGAPATILSLLFHGKSSLAQPSSYWSIVLDDQPSSSSSIVRPYLNLLQLAHQSDSAQPPVSLIDLLSSICCPWSEKP
ncbi:hypothetical protein CRG98_036812 [Punica granatum]|uniref:Uncharacterized protein n=1 Tax=Punica granatum TaxID=22663 RepID=A0A2I0IHK2_PUNGR|nr:hypothetical protein CRG98_036812 [Punica granatum]